MLETHNYFDPTSPRQLSQYSDWAMGWNTGVRFPAG